MNFIVQKKQVRKLPNNQGSESGFFVGKVRVFCRKCRRLPGFGWTKAQRSQRTLFGRAHQPGCAVRTTLHAMHSRPGGIRHCNGAQHQRMAWMPTLCPPLFFPSGWRRLPGAGFLLYPSLDGGNSKFISSYGNADVQHRLRHRIRSRVRSVLRVRPPRTPW